MQHKQTIEDIKIMWFQALETRILEATSTKISCIVLPDREYDSLFYLAADGFLDNIPYWTYDEEVIAFCKVGILKQGEVAIL